MTRLRTKLDPLDTDLLTTLEKRDAGLEALLGKTTRYRHLLRDALSRLRTGAEPGPVRHGVEAWSPLLREVKKLAREL